MIADDDPTAQRLREAVWADPASDAPRMVFADYLLDHGDPMGDMIALQLERARTGAAVSERELELVVAHGRRMLGPVGLWIRRWTFERGFLAAATPVPEIPFEAATHALWSTVERLALTNSNHRVLDNPDLRALHTLHATDEVAFALARRTEPLPIRALASALPHVGLGLAGEHVDVFDHRGAFDRVKVLSLSAWHLERALDRPVLESRLITQLERLDLTFTSIRIDDLQMWRRWFDTSPLASLSIQVPLAQDDPPPGVVPGQQFATRPTRFVCAAIDRASAAITVELDEPTEDRHVADALRILEAFGHGFAHVAIADRGVPSEIDTRQQALIDGLRRGFTAVDVLKRPLRSLAP